MKLKITLAFLMFSLVMLSIPVDAATLSIGERLRGRILLQVESRGEAYYVHPSTSERYYMANGDEAYNIMRSFGVGITNKDLNRLQDNKTEALKNKGKIFLQVESRGEAYYVDFSGNLHYLKNGSEAYSVMRNLGLGITNKDLDKISAKSLSNFSTQNSSNNNPVVNGSGNLQCNGKLFSSCSAGLVFYCPEIGNAICLNGERASAVDEDNYKKDIANIMNNYDERIVIITSAIDEQKKLRDSRIGYLNFLLSGNQKFITTDASINKIIYDMGEYYKEVVSGYEADNKTWNSLKDTNNFNYQNTKKLYANFNNSSNIYSKNDYEKVLNELMKLDNLLNQVINSSEPYTNKIKNAIEEEDKLISSYFSMLEGFNDLQETRLALQRQALAQKNIQNNYIVQINQYNYNIQRTRPISCYSSTTFGLTTTRCY